MDHREGPSLADEISQAPFPIQELLRRAIDLASALNQLHRQGRVHGAVTPEAIVFSTAGAELAEPAGGPRPVTPYTAPEQLRGIIDARSDIFAFGAVVYEMATGRKAFAGVTEPDLKAAILGSQPAPVASLTHDAGAAAFFTALDRVISDCLVKNPEQRRQRIHNVLVDLKLMSAAARAVGVEPALPRPAQPAHMDPLALPVSPAAGESKPTVKTPAPGYYQKPPTHLPDTMPRPSQGVGREAVPAANGATGEKENGRPESSAMPGEREPDTTTVRIQFDSVGRKRSRIRLLTAAPVLAILLALGLAGWAANRFLRGKPSGPAGQLRFSLPPPEQASYMSSPAISPDGKLLAFSAVGPDKKRLLWIRPLSSIKAEWLANTDDAVAPFWSPDGKYLAFFAGRKLKKVPVEGGPVTVLCDTEGVAGGAWNQDGVIVFGRSFYDSLYRIGASGGIPEQVTVLDSSRGERAHLWPVFLPDGKHFVFYAAADQEDNSGVSIGSLNSRTTRHLLSADTNAVYAEKPGEGVKKGYLLFGRSHRLSAHAFDPANLTLLDDQFTVADQINYLEFINLLPISAAANSVLAYQSIDAPRRQLVWYDREGNQVGVLGEPGEYQQVRISPDGTRVALNRQVTGKDTADIWIFDVESKLSYPFTTEPTHEGAPVWSPDGKQMVYFSNPNGHFDLFVKSVGTSSRQEPLAVSGADKYPNDWSSDGQYLLYGSMGSSTNSDLWVLPMKGQGGDPFPYLQTINSEGYARFSPDTKWVAYQSDETGRVEVYVDLFPRTEGHSRRWQISTEGGGLPKWRGDGRELYYIMANGRMMAVSLNTREGLNPSPPRMLFQTRALPRDWNMFDAMADGRRFLVNTPLEWSSSSPIIVVTNWTEGFKK